jgi:hypothetical protein
MLKAAPVQKLADLTGQAWLHMALTSTPKGMDLIGQTFLIMVLKPARLVLSHCIILELSFIWLGPLRHMPQP